MIRIVISLLAASTLAAQAPTRADLLKLTDQLETAIDAGDWSKAAQLSRTLRAAVQEARNQSMAAAGNELADSILSWLPVDTETLVVAQEPFTIAAEDQTNIPSALSGAQAYVLGLLNAAEGESLFKALVGRTVRLAALGARRFGEESTGDRPPGQQSTSRGTVSYQGCAVYAFAEPLPDPILARPPEESIMGNRAWISQGSENDAAADETYLVSLLKPDLMMACNNRDFFREMVSRMGSAQQTRALPPDLPEWKQLDRTAPLWGISHYSGNIIPSTAGSEFAATGVTVAFGLPFGAAQARIISKSDPWKELLDDSEFKDMATSHEISEGVWEVSVAGRAEAAPIAILVLMSALGFSVAI